MPSNGIGELNARFTDEMVIDCRRRCAAGELTAFELATVQRVSRRTANSLLQGYTYAHLNEVAPPPLTRQRRTGRPKVHNEAALTTRVRELRARDLNNRQIGEMLGLDRGTVSRLYNHGRVRPQRGE